MKKIFIFLLSLTIIVIAALVYHMVIPYEVKAEGYKTTMPGPSGGDLLNFITKDMPYKKWDLWPGKKAMYRGTKPHGDFITLYVNKIALISIKKSKTIANHSIIMKENYTADKKLAALTIMYKVKGYNPDGGDWFWAKYNADNTIAAEGKVKGCLGCHAVAKDNDYIFTGKTDKGSTPGYDAPGYDSPGYGAPGYDKPGKRSTPGYK
jgi:hypothetical protein